MTRVGIELSSTACRLVQIDDAVTRWPSQETGVRSFALLPLSGADRRAAFESLRRHRTAVIVWGAAREVRQVVVTAGSYEAMRAEAIDALSAAGVHTRGMWIDIAPASSAPNGTPRRTVVAVLADGAVMSAALRPLADAGIRIRTVMTPAMALGSLARIRRDASVPGAIEAYVALEETATCITFVRDGALVAARELTWGYRDDDGDGTQVRRREVVGARLADELTEFFGAANHSPGAMGLVCVCGGFPELRSMTVLLMERLAVEVEPLDSDLGIDAARHPDPADESRGRSADLRVAWSVVADWPAPLNLLRARNRQASKAVLARAAVVAGMAAGLGAGLGIEHSRWWRSTAPTRVAPAGVKTPSPASLARATVRSARWPTPVAPAVVRTLLTRLRSGS